MDTHDDVFFSSVIVIKVNITRGPGFARVITGCAVCSTVGRPNCNKLSVRVSFIEEVLFGCVGGDCDAMGGKRGVNRT